MKYELMLRSRAIPHQSFETKHLQFFSGLRDLPHPWGISAERIPPCPGMGSHELKGVRFGRLLGKGVKAQVVYLFRHAGLAVDEAMNDDFVDMSFDPTHLDFKVFVQQALPKYIEVFNVYLAQVKDDDFLTWIFRRCAS